MKKAQIALLSVVLVVLLSLPVSAAGSSVALTPDAVSVCRGDTFTITAELSNTESIQMCTVALDYDTTALKLLSGECHVSGLSLGTVLPNENVGTFLQVTGTKVSGKVFSFEFQVLDTAAFGEYAISAEASIGVSEPENIETTGTKVTIAAPQEVLPETTAPEPTAGQTINPQPTENAGDTQATSAAPTDAQEPPETQETVKPTQSASEMPTDPVLTIGAVQEETPWKTPVWTAVAAAVAFGVIKLIIARFRKKDKE